jgi:hypothetical protein
MATWVILLAAESNSTADENFGELFRLFMANVERAATTRLTAMM